ncbi:MAG: sulfatase-like hydrolase/transferase [Planctomycetaceae bacterium]|nr:sulfatase-like hydrolase/transferase [Planctomycetaceae bacterium]
MTIKPSRFAVLWFFVFANVLAAADLPNADLPNADLPNADLPNIVLVFVDDLGYGDLGCYGNTQIRTPNIDRLATQGQRWTSFYSAGSTCVTSRTGLMTGRHPSLLAGAKLVDSRESMMASMFQKHGYATAVIGKWHLADWRRHHFVKSPMHPLECGFQHYFGTPASNDIPAPPGKIQNRELFDHCDKFTFPVPLIRGREVIEYPANQELFTQRYTAEAIKWIHNHRHERFFLYLPHNMPHAPVFASKSFQGRSEAGEYGDVIEEIDWSVGELTAALDDLELSRKTLFVFTSDNGPWKTFEVHGGSSGPLRGEKGTSWEGGYRVPAIFRWPGKIKSRSVDGIGASVDLYATFAALIGAEQPVESTGYVSQDLRAALLDGRKSPRTAWLMDERDADAFRSGKWKIHLSTLSHLSDPVTRQAVPSVKHDPPLLFDLANDLSEQRNVASTHPEVVQRLLKQMQAFQTR